MNMMSRNVAVNARIDVMDPDLAATLGRHRKWPLRYRSVETLAICADITIIFAASMLADLSQRPGHVWAIADASNATGAAIVVAALFVSLLKTQGLHAPAKLFDARRQFYAVCLCWAATFLVLSASTALLGVRAELPPGFGMSFAAFGALMLITQRLLAKALLAKGLNERRFSGGKVLLLTDHQRSSSIAVQSSLATLGYRVAHQFNLPRAGASASHRRHLCSLVARYVREQDIEDIIVETHPDRWCEVRELITGLKHLPIPVVLLSSATGCDLLKRPMRNLGDAVGIELQSRPLTQGGHLAKRCMDLAGAVFGLIILSPLMVIVAAIIRMDSDGPILFRQHRCGFNGRYFTIYKFRTMTVLEDGPTITQAAPADRRVTRVGRWLRHTSIDELPQLWNVLRGDMSLVGPRPHAAAHDAGFECTVPRYAGRRRVKPGLTGWAQIHGCRGPTPTVACIEQRVGYDLWYIDNWTFSLDLAILLRTPMEVLRARNAL